MVTIQYILLAVSFLIVVVFMVKVYRVVNSKEKYTPSQKKAIEIYKYLPKAGDTKRYCIGLLLFLLIAMMSCTPKAYLPNGCRYNVNAPKFTK